jgi:pyrroloquinoline quinone biosynthesis protein D
MSAAQPLAFADVPAIPARYRLQWEPAQQGWVLLFPEGMVKLSASAAEIVKRVDGRASVDEIMHGLEQAFPGTDLRGDVLEFLNAARERGWIEICNR